MAFSPDGFQSELDSFPSGIGLAVLCEDLKADNAEM